jgi:hypothetical protein
MTEEQKDYQVKYVEPYDDSAVMDVSLEHNDSKESIVDEYDCKVEPNQFYLS